MSTTTFTVVGMSCGGCVGKVTEALTGIVGVLDAAVNLASGQVAVTCDVPVDRSAFRAAVESAGYAIAGSKTANEHTS